MSDQVDKAAADLLSAVGDLELRDLPAGDERPPRWSPEKVVVLAAAAVAIGFAILAFRSDGRQSTFVGTGGPQSVAPGTGGGDWETFHGFGRWTLDPDRRTVRIERSSLVGCAEHRAVIDAEADDQWLVRIETRSGGDCPAAPGCDGEAGCSRALQLERAVPAGVEVRAVCDPGASLFATTVPGGAAVTLAPEPDGSEPVICSPVPEPADPPPPATDPARGPLIVERCIEPPAPPPPSGPLSVEPAPVPAGGELRFEWTVEAAQRIVVSDEMVVSCWTGRAWTPAWIASSVFTDPRSELLTDQSDTVMTANGFEQAAGTIPIPSGAPPGTYRILAPFSLDLDDGSTDSGVAEVFFTVVPGD